MQGRGRGWYHYKRVVDSNFEGRGRIGHYHAVVVEYLCVHTPTLGRGRHVALRFAAEGSQRRTEEVGVSQGPSTGEEVWVVVWVHAAEPVVVAGEGGAERVVEHGGDEGKLCGGGEGKGGGGSGDEESVV